MACLQEIDTAEAFLDSKHYSAIGCDLRNLELVQKLLIKSNVDFSIPTLIISECVLTYITPTE